MLRRKIAFLMAFAVSNLIVIFPVFAAEIVVSGMRIQPPSLEQPGGVTAGIISIGIGKIALLDFDRKKIFLVDVNESKVVPMEIPQDYQPIFSLRLNGRAIELVSPAGQVNGQLVLNSISDLSSTKWSKAEARETALNKQAVRGFDVSRGDANSLRVSVKSDVRGNLETVVRPIIGDQVAAINLVVQHPNGEETIQWEELIHKGKEEMVDAVVGRFARNGKLVKAARVPLQEEIEVPESYVAIDSDGHVYYASTSGSKVSVRALEMVEVNLVRESPRQNSRQNSRNAQTQTAEERAFEIFSRKEAQAELGIGERAANKLQKISREKILENAKASLNVVWTVQQYNLKRPGIQSVCDTSHGKFWEAVPQVVGYLNKKLTLLPYRWGGTSTPSSFIKRVGEGALAGDICTCRDSKKNYCIVPESAGVDCSGFVSNAWGVGRYTTSSLPSIAKKVENLSRILPGDILNFAGHHVRLFVKFEPGAEVRLRTLESAISCGGVCERVYTPVQLKDYKALRFNFIE